MRKNVPLPVPRNGVNSPCYISIKYSPGGNFVGMAIALLMPAGGAGWKITQSFPEKERERGRQSLGLRASVQHNFGANIVEGERQCRIKRPEHGHIRSLEI